MINASSKIVREESVKPYRSPQQKRQRLIAVIAVLLIIGLGAGAYFLIVPREETYFLRSYDTEIVRQADLIQTTQASGAVAFPVQITVLNSAAGYASELYVQEGDPVLKGQLLARMDVPDLQDELEDLKSSLADAKLNLEKFVKQNEFAIGSMEREIGYLEEDIEEAREEYDSVAQLVKVGGASKSDLDKAEETINDLIQNKREKELQLSEDVEMQEIDNRIREADITGKETKITRLIEQIEAASIISPMDGEILEIDSALGVPGSRIAANRELFTVANPSSAVVELEVLEQYSGLLSIDQIVDLTVGSEKLYGSITSIGKVAQISSDGLGATVLIKVKPQSTSESLLLGSTAVGIFEVGVQENALLLSRGPYLTTGSQRYLYKVEGDAAIRVDVTFGDIQGNDVEILKGVEVGDEIIVSGYQNFIEYREVKLEEGE